MTQKLTSSIIGVALLALPVLASADQLVPLGPNEEQLLAREVAIKTIEQGASVGCGVKASAAKVAVNQPFVVRWASFGADIGANGLAIGGWAPFGSQTILASRPGQYKYEFKFYGFGPAQATCTTFVTVS